MRKLLHFFFLLCVGPILAQNTTVSIGLIGDRVPDNDLAINYENNLKEEILLLLQHRYTVEFKTYYLSSGNDDLIKVFDAAYAENEVVVTTGTVTTNGAIALKNYPRPTVGSIVLDTKLQGLDKTSEGTSGIPNFTYMESPFDMKRDLKLLYEIYPFTHLEVMTEQASIGDESFFKQLFENYLDGKNVSVDVIFYNEDINEHVKEMASEKVAVYALPYFGRDSSRLKNFFEVINKNKVPSSALFGEQYIAAGALSGHETADNLQKIPRRIALTVMKILEGQAPADLSVEIQTFSDNLLINMETARQIGIYPNFDLMSEATLINLEKIQTDNQLTLHSAITQALQSNLGIRIEQADVKIAETEIDLAKADLLPQATLSSAFSVTDELTTLSRQGAQGRANWLLSGEVSQTVFAEPVLANIMIQKLLQESEQKALLQTQLDVVIDVAGAYMNILFAKSNLNIQQQNVERNKENFDIAKAKEAIGYTGASDINRWEAELANANIDLNNAFASLRQAKFQLNQLLNRPINEPVEIEDASLGASALLIADSRMEVIDNYGTLEKFSDFLVQYAMERLPELAQIDLGLRAQERLQLSRERAMYLPTVGLSGSANRVLGRIDIPESLPPIDKSTTWDISLGVSYPIFQGNSRKKLIEQSKLNVIQLQDNRRNVKNQLELLIRANIETVGASYSRMGLAQKAADASRKNYEIVQDAYSAGQSNITTLIDAQNNAQATELNADNAIFTFILDFLTLERSIGYFNFLAQPVERDAFFQDMQTYMNQN